jgi:hypothetical protein
VKDSMARRKFWRKSKGPIQIDAASPKGEEPVEGLIRARPGEVDPFNPPDASPHFQSNEDKAEPEAQPEPEAQLQQLQQQPRPEAQSEAESQEPELEPEPTARAGRPVDLFVEPEVIEVSKKGLRKAKKAERKVKRDEAVRGGSDLPDEPGRFHEGALIEPWEGIEDPPETESQASSVRTPSSEAVQLRRQANARAARRARFKIGGAVVVSALMVGGSVLGSIWLQGRTPEPEVMADLPVGSTSIGESLVMTLMEGDKAVGVAFVVTHPTEDDKVILLPTSLLVILPGYGRFELSEAI